MYTYVRICIHTYAYVYIRTHPRVSMQPQKCMHACTCHICIHPCKVGILSGGFTYFAQRLQAEMGIDYVFANELDFVDGKLTGKVKGDIVDGERKALLLQQIAAENGLSLKQVVHY